MVRAGLLSDEQLAAVQATSAERKLSFVEALLAHGFADEDSVVGFLHSKLMIPKVGASILEGVDRSALDRVPGDLAARHAVLPISSDETGNLTLAMVDPTDMKAVDAISAHTGAYLVRAVAPLRVIRSSIHRHYGIEAPPLPELAPRAAKPSGPAPAAVIPPAPVPSASSPRSGPAVVAVPSVPAPPVVPEIDAPTVPGAAAPAASGASRPTSGIRPAAVIQPSAVLMPGAPRPAAVLMPNAFAPSPYGIQPVAPPVVAPPVAPPVVEPPVPSASPSAPVPAASSSGPVPAASSSPRPDSQPFVSASGAPAVSPPPGHVAAPTPRAPSAPVPVARPASGVVAQAVTSPGSGPIAAPSVSLAPPGVEVASLEPTPPVYAGGAMATLRANEPDVARVDAPAEDDASETLTAGSRSPDVVDIPLDDLETNERGTTLVPGEDAAKAAGWNPPSFTAANEIVPLSPEAFHRLLPRFATVKTRDEVTDLLLDFLAEGFSRVIMFVHIKGEIRGRDARGEDLLVEAVRQIRIPAGGPSVFSGVIERRAPYFGPMRTDTPIDAAFFSALGGVEGVILVLPVLLRDKVPLIVFASGSSNPVDPRSLHDLTHEVAAALERIIVLEKQRGGR